MEIIAGKYVIEFTQEGLYYAYLVNHGQCCAYGDTQEEAVENLAFMAEEFFGEVDTVYGGLDDFS